jgi:outer membrane protein
MVRSLGVIGGTAAIALLATLAPARAETLAEAIADTYRNNPTLKAQRAELRVIDETYIQAGSPYRLQMSVSASAEWSQDRGRDFAGVRRTTSDDLSTVGLNASQILFNGGRTAAQLSAADADVLSARERLREVENNILLSVIDAYSSVRRDAEIVAIRERSLAAFGRQVDQARARRAGGDLTRTDVAQAEAQAAIARVSLSQAQADLQFSRGRFATLVGRNPGVLDPEPPLPGLPTSIDESYRLAGEESPSFRQSVYDERAGRARVAAARAENNPVVGLSGTAGYTGPADFNTSDYRRNLVGRVTFLMPLMTGNLLESRRRQAVADRDRLENVIEESRRGVDLDVLRSWNQVVSATQQLQSGEEAVRAAEVSSLGSSREFREGLRSTFEMLNEEQRLLEAQLVVTQARYTRYVGQAGLLATLGRLDAAQLDAGIPRYDPVVVAEQRRGRIFGPFDPVLVPIDRLQKPSDATKPVPTLAYAPMPEITEPTTSFPSDAPLAQSVPEGRPVCGDKPC